MGPSEERLARNDIESPKKKQDQIAVRSRPERSFSVPRRRKLGVVWKMWIFLKKPKGIFFRFPS
jgi:hypothetical protein